MQQKSRRDPTRWGPSAMSLVLAAATTVVIALGLIRRPLTADHRLRYLPALVEP